jgi:hypothetical protein
VLVSVEFQKQGLPHAHILVWLKNPCTEGGVTQLADKFISAEMPDPKVDPLGYSLVEEFMMHGPCGPANKNCPCMKDNMCSKIFPKDFQNENTVDDNGFVVYRQRDTGVAVNKNGALDNRHVVPYNMALLKKYQAHINVEWCNRTELIKYLFKYVTKGTDRAKVVFTKYKKRTHCVSVDTDTAEQSDVHGRRKKRRLRGALAAEFEKDEIQDFLNCRYLCDKECIWRLFGYDVHMHFPTVERLACHLPSMNTVIFKSTTHLPSLLSTPRLQRTTLTSWFVANKKFPSGRSLTYCEYPSSFTWSSENREWTKRKYGNTIGRIYYIPPNTGECFYLRMLLMYVKGAESYEDVRTFEGVVYATFKEACAARGLVGDDEEWFKAFDEAVRWGMGGQLRALFVMMFMYCGIGDELAFFEKYWCPMSDDILYNLLGA